MKTFILYQETLSEEIHSEINELGWEGIFKKYPDFKKVKDLSFAGSEGKSHEEIEKIFNEYYIASAEVSACTITDVFHHSNTYNKQYVTKLYGKCRSASVGDIIYDVKENAYHIINPVGLEKLDF